VSAFADHGDGDDIFRSKMLLQTLKYAQTLRDGLIQAVAIYAGHFRIVTRQNLGPPRLRVGLALNVDLNVFAAVIAMTRRYRQETLHGGITISSTVVPRV